jgi:cytochrome c oxidase subunit 4
MTMSARPIFWAAIALLVLTGISWALAHVDLGAAGTPVALAIAAVKASVVALAFMEVGRTTIAARVVGVVTLSFIALLCLGFVADVALR